MKKENNFFKSLSFIFSFMKKYYIILFISVVFLFLTTYFNVLSPKLMGNSIDEMISYVGQAKTENIKDDIADGKGISIDDKKMIIQNMSLNKDQENQIMDATPKELTSLYNNLKFKEDLFKMDNKSILKGEGFSSEQIEFIKNSDLNDNLKKVLTTIPASGISDEQKQALNFMNIDENTKIFLLNYNGEYVLRTYMQSLGGLTTKEQDDLAKMNIEQMNDLYNLSLVRMDAIKKDKSILDEEDATFSKKQINFINKSSLSQSQKESILNLNSSQIKEVYNNRAIEIDSNNQYKTFIKSILFLLAMYLALAISMFIYNILMAIVAGKSTRDMRKGLFGKIEKLSIRFFDQSNAGDLLSRFTNDIDNISNAMNQSLVQVLSQSAMLFGVIIMMFNEDNTQATINLFNNDIVVNNVLTWTMLMFAVVAIVIALFIVSKARYHVSRQQKKLGALNGYIDERISGQKVVISYGLEDETIEKFEEYNEDLRKTSVLGQIYSGALMPAMQGIGLVNLGFLVFLGSIFISKDLMSIGLLVAFIQYSQRFFNPLAQVFAQYNMIELALTGASRVKEVFETKVEIFNNKDAKDIKGIDGTVLLENVNFGYEKDKPVLKDINIEVKKGEMIALVGPTGSGKTTVMNLMNRFYDIDSGKIEFDGKNIQDITLDTLRKNVGIVLQESILFKGTIKDNIAYGKKDASEEEIIDAAKTANIHEFIMSLEEGYDTKVDNNTSMFSTGQKQLMSIARTILTDPDLLILDEATSNVDTVTEEKIQKAMENVMKGRTSFVIAHRLKTILNATKIIVLKDGEIIEEGSHIELLKQEGFYAELYHNQFVVE